MLLNKFKKLKKRLILKKINIIFLTLVSTLSFSQNENKIVVKQQGVIFFYRVGNANDSIITKNIADTFFVKMSDDKKASTEIKLKNATFIKTNDEHFFKLAYTPGMKYSFIYSPETTHQKNKNSVTYSPLIGPDGANTDGKKEIVIELWDLKANKKSLTNVFTYKQN